MSNVELAKNTLPTNTYALRLSLQPYAEELGLSEEIALKIGTGFGSGMCKDEVCGTVTGAIMVIGSKYGQCKLGDTESRIKTNELTCLMLNRFKEENGSYLCKDLLGYDLSIKEEAQCARESGLFTDFCPKMVESAAKTLDAILSQMPSAIRRFSPSFGTDEFLINFH